MVTLYTNEKLEQIIACLFGKAICFFLFFHFGVFLSQDIGLKEISDSNHENSTYQYQVIDSCHSSIHTLGGAVIVNNTNIEKQTTLVTNKKTVRISNYLNKKQPTKKLLAKKNYLSNSLFYQSIINKLKLFYENSTLSYYVVFINNNIPKSKSVLQTSTFSLLFIFILILLKNNNFNLCSRHLFINSYRFYRPPPFRYT